MTQTQRTLALLCGLLALAVGLGLYAYYGVMKKDETESTRKELQDHLFAAVQPGEKSPDGGAPLLEFSRITVTAKGATTVLEKAPGGAWAITAPVQAPVDKLTVDSLVSQLQTAKFKDLVDEAPDDAALARYGLKAPQFSVTAEASLAGAGGAQGKREVALQGGIENTFDGSVYLQRKGEKPVYSAQGGVRWSLEKTTYELRDKELFAFEEPKLKSLEVKSKRNGYALERDAAKSWRLTRPFASAADATSLASMLSSLKSERALAFPADGAEARQALGLEVPVTDATFTLVSGEKVRVRFGSPGADGGDKAYALREGPGVTALLAEVSTAAVTQLDKNPDDLKDRSVLSFKREDVSRLTFHPTEGADLVVQKKAPPADGGGGEEWEVRAPEQGPAKKWKLSSVLWLLASLRAAQFDEESPKDWARYGIDAKSRQVALAGADGAELARLVVGKDVPGKAGMLYARGSKPQLLELDGSRLADLPQALSDVLDRPAPVAVDGGGRP